MADKKIKDRDIAEVIANNRGYLTKVNGTVLKMRLEKY